MKAVTKELTVLAAQPADKMKLARRTFTLEFKADVVRHRKAENLSWADARKACDVLPKLVKDWEALYRASSPERLDAAWCRLSRPRLAHCARSSRG